MKVELIQSTGRIARTIVGGFLVLLLSSCSGVFDIHPYDVNVHGEKDINAKQMKVIESKFADKKTLRVAFISDTHLWLADAKDQVADLNKRGDIDFVVHCGDLTDTATNDEFEWSRDILYGLNYPFVALIGNHDFLGTGDQSYEVMYGAFDFSFIAGRVKFLCLNTNATEYDYMAAVPNFDYMEEQFTTDTDKFDRTVVIMHACPYSDQFNNNVCKAFRRYLDFAPGLMCCVYGHEFWKSQPSRYPDKYYEFMSTKFRLNLALGQRITLKIPENKRKLHNRISLFYEVGTCDLYIRSLFQGQDVKIKDILGLSIGMKFYMK